MRKIGYILAIIGIAWSASAIWRVLTKAGQIEQWSARQSLAAAIVDQLDKHFAGHGKYPKSITKLPIRYSELDDGANPAMLDEFSYSTDGSSYSLDWDDEYPK